MSNEEHEGWRKWAALARIFAMRIVANEKEEICYTDIGQRVKERWDGREPKEYKVTTKTNSDQNQIQIQTHLQFRKLHLVDIPQQGNLSMPRRMKRE